MAGPSKPRAPRGRASTRPAASRPRPTAARTARVPVAARPKLTGRAVVLLLVIAVLVISYASSMRAYLAQRTHIAETRSKIELAKQNIKNLEREKKRWTDPAYVEAQARGRLGWVLPGEIGYQVIGRDGKPLGSADELGNPADVVPLTRTPIWTTLYQSARLADHPPELSDPNTPITPRTTKP